MDTGQLSAPALGKSGTPRLDASAPEGVPVQCRRLESVLRDLAVSQVDLIKVAVEGAEAAVLRGAIETLARDRPVVLFEVNPQADGSVPAAEPLAQLGYALHGVAPGPQSRSARLVRRRWARTGAGWPNHGQH